MKNVLLTAVGAAMALSAVAARSTEIGFRFEADHPDCLYRLGEECVLTVTATNGAGEAVKDWHCGVEIDNYGGTVYEVIKEVDFAKTNPFVLKARPTKPGFVRFRMRGSDRKGDYLSGLWAVGFDPEKIRPATERPADFEEFWRAAIAKFEREVPIDAKMELNKKESNATHDCYELTFATVPKGRVIRGQLSIPKKEGRFPVLMNVPGAGSGSWGWIKLNDCCYLTLNVLDYPRRPNREVKDDVAALYKDQNLRWSMKSGLDKDPWYFVGDLSKNREDFFYYGAILGINRAVDWIAKLPRIDTSSFRYEGQSQGGAFGIILSALNRNLTRAQIGEPAITDISGYLVDKRQSGWPLLPERLKNHPELQANALKIAPYFDCAHFVPMITIPTRWNVGFIDELCPPHAVYAGYNSLRSKDHRILNFPGLGHGTPPKKYSQAVQATVKSWEDPAAEFRAYTVQEAGHVSKMEAFDNPLFEQPDVPGVKLGDPEKRRMPHCGYNGSGGLRIEPTPAGKGKKVQTRHNFVHKLGKLEKGRKYVWSIKTKLHGDSYCHVAWEGSCQGKHVKGNWSVRRKPDEAGWVHNEIDIVVPEDKEIDRNTLLVIVTRNATAEGEAWCDFDNLDFREDVPEWTLANTWPIHNQVYNDEGRVRFYTEFVGDFIPKGAQAAYLCEVVDDEGGTVSSVVCTPKDGVFTADFKPLAYTGKGKLRVSCMDRTHRVCAGVKEFAVDVLPRPFEKKDVIYVDELGRMRMNGKFFMPLGFYTSFGRGNEFDDERFTREMDEFKKNGANLIVEYWPEKWERPGNRWYDIAYEHGVYVFRNYCSVWHHRTDGTLPTYFESARKMAKIPAVVGFYSFDELPTDWAQWYADFRRGLHEAAPDEVVWYSNIFNPAPFLISGDISGCGSYPVRAKEEGSADGFAESINSRILPNSRVKSASWLPYGQSFNWSDYKEWKNDREQYIAKGKEFGYEDMMAEALLFFSYGARGMLYFSFSGVYAGPVPELYPKRHADCMRVMRELRALEKFVMGTKPIAEVPHRDLKGKTRVVKLTADDGEEIVFAISLSAGENECEFDFGGKRRHYLKGPIAAEIYRTVPADAYRVGSYNIRLASPYSDKMDGPNRWDNRKEALVAQIRQLDLDAFGLQEVTPLQARYLKENLPDYEFVGEHRGADRKSDEASPVAYRKSRFVAEKSGTFWLSETPDVPGVKGWGAACPRVCSYLVLRDRSGGKRFCFANTHTDHKSAEAREKGMLLIIDRMKEFGKGAPIVFTGDHNCRHEDAPALAVRKHLSDARDCADDRRGPRNTFQGFGKFKDGPSVDGKDFKDHCIDYIYVTPGTRVFDFATHDETRGEGLYMSDHYPVTATIRF